MVIILVVIKFLCLFFIRFKWFLFCNIIVLVVLNIVIFITFIMYFIIFFISCISIIRLCYIEKIFLVFFKFLERKIYSFMEEVINFYIYKCLFI